MITCSDQAPTCPAPLCPAEDWAALRLAVLEEELRRCQSWGPLAQADLSLPPTIARQLGVDPIAQLLGVDPEAVATAVIARWSAGAGEEEVRGVQGLGWPRWLGWPLCLPACLPAWLPCLVGSAVSASCRCEQAEQQGVQASLAAHLQPQAAATPRARAPPPPPSQPSATFSGTLPHGL